MMSDKLRISPVGTCRIHTPLRRGTSRHPFELNLRRNYGFVHTTVEALQQLRFLMGGQGVPERLAPLVYRATNGRSAQDAAPEPSDLYFVEISSAKNVTIDRVPVQINYTGRHFGDFFSDRALAKKFWQLAGEGDGEALQAFLDLQGQYHRLSSEDRELLAGIRVSQMSEDEIHRDMAEITEMMGRDRLVFVTHVNALTPDDNPVASRLRVIQAVKKAASNLAVPCYDPTAAMRRFGQMQALEKDGLDLTHFTTAFSDLIMAEWHKDFISPRSAREPASGIGPVARGPEENLARLRNLVDQGRIVEASIDVRAALRRQVDPEHQRLLGQIQFGLGDYEGAIGSLEAARQQLGAVEEDDVMLMQSQFAVGSAEAALRYGQALLSDEVETREILSITAEAAGTLGRDDVALPCWKRLFQLEGDAAAASAVLEALSRQGDPIALCAWSEAVLQDLPAHKPSFLALWRTHLAAREGDQLVALAARARPLTDDEVLTLAGESAAEGFWTAAAALVAPRMFYSSDQARILAWIASQTDAWVAEGLQALSADDYPRAADAIQAASQLVPTRNAIVRGRRALDQKLRTEVRQAFMAKDHERVLRLAELAQRTGLEFTDLDKLAGRSAVELGQLQAALVYLKRASESDPTGAAQIQLARAAVKAEDYLEALSAYEAVSRMEGVGDWAMAEAEKNLTGLTSRAFKFARQLVADGSYARGWELLGKLALNADVSAKAEQEQDRLLTQLRNSLKKSDPAHTSVRLALAEELLGLTPSDAFGLKVAATSSMRLHQFDAALAYWDRLEKVAGKSPQITMNANKCRLWITRSRKTAA